MTAATPMALVSITYASAVSALLSPDGIDERLRDTRARNATRGITGLLLHWGGSFVQHHEGPWDSIEALLERICSDGITPVLRFLTGEIASRAFPDWSMGLERTPPSPEAQAHPTSLTVNSGLSPQ